MRNTSEIDLIRTNLPVVDRILAFHPANFCPYLRLVHQNLLCYLVFSILEHPKYVLIELEELI